MAVELVAVGVAVLVGALIKSITGMGLPPIAIPVLALFIGPQDAVVIITLSTIVTNTYLAWIYRDAAKEARHLPAMIVAGSIGAPIGVYALANIDANAVGVILAVTVIAYIVVTWWRPDLKLSAAAARWAAVPVGLAGGVLQGATGLSSVVLASYIHALGLSPRAFVFMISTLFQVFALVQALGFVVAGMYTPDIVVASLVAAAAATVVLIFGTRRLAVRISPAVFNRLVMGVLALSAVKMLFDALI